MNPSKPTVFWPLGHFVELIELILFHLQILRQDIHLHVIVDCV